MTRPNHIQSFPRFIHLPTELRHRIWQLSLPGPRIVEIQEVRVSRSLSFDSDDEEHDYTTHDGRKDNGEESEIYKIITSSALPAHFATCHEAASIARQYYTKLFIRPLSAIDNTSTDAPSVSSASVQSGICINVNQDILYISPFTFSARSNAAYARGHQLQRSNPIWEIPFLGSADMKCIKRLGICPASFGIHTKGSGGSRRDEGVLYPEGLIENSHHDDAEEGRGGQYLWALLFVLRFFEGVEVCYISFFSLLLFNNTSMFDHVWR